MSRSEIEPLLIPNQNQPFRELTTFDHVKTGIRLFTSVFEGAANWTSTFGPIAIYYSPGLWLIAPAALGAAISLTNEAVEALLQRLPNNRFLQALHKGSFFLSNGVGEFFGNFGFTWTMITTVGMDIGGVRLYSDTFGKIIAPALALVPAGLSTRFKYDLAQGNLTERGLVRHIAALTNGGISPSGVLDVLIQQGQLSLNSFVPTTIILITALLGLLQSLGKEAYPALSKTILFIITAVCTNPSLAATMFHFPLDIYAAEHDDGVTNDLFYGVLGGSCFFFTLLSIVSFIDFQLQLVEPQKKKPSIVVEEVRDPEDVEAASDEELLTFSMSDFSSDDEDCISRKLGAMKLENEYGRDTDTKSESSGWHSLSDDLQDSEPLLDDQVSLSVNTASPLPKEAYNEPIRENYRQLTDEMEGDASGQSQQLSSGRAVKSKNRYPFFASRSFDALSQLKQGQVESLNIDTGYQSC
ncbi:hypothetical protein [Legionella birminghamensis]|nr:hypothetical protein [Legionella birminghamensis]